MLVIIEAPAVEVGVECWRQGLPLSCSSPLKETETTLVLIRPPFQEKPKRCVDSFSSCLAKTIPGRDWVMQENWRISGAAPGVLELKVVPSSSPACA